jgi:hypothetical protein
MIDKIFETSESNGEYPVENLTTLAGDLGLNQDDFKTCVESSKIKEKINND